MPVFSLTSQSLMRSLSSLLSFYRRMNVHSLLAMAGMAGPLLLGATDLTAATTSPGYSLIRDSISSLSLASLGWLQIIGFLFIGLLIEIFTAGLLFNIRGARAFRFAIALMVLFGFALLLIGAFRTDPVGAPRTIEGRIHGLAATTAFWLFPAAILALTPSLRKDPHWRAISSYSLIAAGLAVALVIMLGALNGEINWFGLLERLVVANMIIWVEVAAVKLMLLSLKKRQEVLDKAVKEEEVEVSPDLP